MLPPPSLSRAGWSVLQSAPVAPAAADKTLGMALMSARVYATGVLAGGTALSASRGTAGEYEVAFDRSVTDCTFTASTGQAAPSTNLYVLTALALYSGNSVKNVTVHILDPNNALLPEDGAFHLLVFCHK